MRYVKEMVNKPRLLADYQKKSLAEAELMMRKISGQKVIETVVIKENLRSLKFVRATIDNNSLPEWFDGNIRYISKAINYNCELNPWERWALKEYSLKYNIRFECAEYAESALRVIRARYYMYLIAQEIKDVPSHKKFEAYEKKQILRKLKKSVENGTGVPRTAMVRLAKEVANEEQFATSKSINWNAIIKVPRIA